MRTEPFVTLLATLIGRRYAETLLTLMGYEAKVPTEPYAKAAPVASPAGDAATKP